MSGYYRVGDPGEDCLAHINTGRRSSGERCASPRMEADNPVWGNLCRRMSEALCDFPKCDKPMCGFHRTKDPSKVNTDYCPLHKDEAGQGKLPL